MSTVHVVPLRDLIEHDVPGGIPGYAITKAGADSWLSIACPDPETEPCICDPTPELVPNPRGPDGWVVTHHSLDGRELSE